VGGLTSRLRATLASSSKNKLRELRAALPEWEIELLDADEYPPEDADTHYGNARIKALFGRSIERTDAWVLGEDSGVAVDALGGRPGVASARWATDHIGQLLRELDGVEDRRARFVCALVAVAPDGREVRATETLEGTIAESPRGSEGFGYDPIMVPLGETRTVAELGNAWKAQNSHRARAARALAEAVRSGVSPAERA